MESHECRLLMVIVLMELVYGNVETSPNGEPEIDLYIHWQSDQLVLVQWATRSMSVRRRGNNLGNIKS